MTNDETQSIRIPKSLFDELRSMCEELGDVSVTWLATRCVQDMIEMSRQSPGARVVPKLIRMLDEMRSKDQLLPEPGARRGAAEVSDRPRGGGHGQRKFVVKGAKG